MSRTEDVFDTVVSLPRPAVFEAQELPLDSVLDSPFQPRTRSITKREVEELMASIEANGQTAPIIVTPAPLEGEGRYHVQSGHRRCAALRYLGAKSVKAVVRRDLDERGARKLALADNLGREDLSAFEQATALKEFCEAYEVSAEAAAAELGIKRAQAYRLKNLLSASEQLLEVIRDGAIPAKSADLLARLDRLDSRKALRMARKVVDGQVSGAVLATEVKALGGKKRVRAAARSDDIQLKRERDNITLRVSVVTDELSEVKRARVIHAVAQFLAAIGVDRVDAGAWHEDATHAANG